MSEHFKTNVRPEKSELVGEHRIQTPGYVVRNVLWDFNTGSSENGAELSVGRTESRKIVVLPRECLFEHFKSNLGQKKSKLFGESRFKDPGYV